MTTAAELEAQIKALEKANTALQVENEKFATESWLFRTLMSSVSDYIYFKDLESRFIMASEAHAKSFGLESAKEMVGKSDFDFFTEEHAKPAYEDEQKIIKTGEPITLEEKETRPDGSVSWALTLKMPMYRDGEISGTFGISKDITDRRVAEDELKAFAATLEARVAERTEELEREIAERKKSEEERARLQEDVITAQKQAIQELATPIIPIMEGIIVMPLIGQIDSQRASDTMRTLLAGISQHRANLVILDITGVPFMDTGIANHLNKTILAARLKGTQVMVTGMSDVVAETIVDLGIDWSGIETLRDLRSGFMEALRLRGFTVSKR
jgi:rsbT co-antagonist protein RsbR